MSDKIERPSWAYDLPPGGSASVGGEANRTGGPPPNLSGRWTDGRPPEMRENATSPAPAEQPENTNKEAAEDSSGDSSTADDKEAEPTTNSDADGSTASDDAPDLTAISREIENIEKVMRENRREYDAKYATRYGELLAARDAAQQAAAVEAALKSTADAVLGEVKDAQAFEQSFAEAFSNLTGDGQAALRQALAVPLAEPSRGASETSLEAFKAHGPEAEATLNMWGKAAAKKFAAAEQRLDRLCDSLSEQDEKAVTAWLKGLDAGARAAVVRALAGT
jgi:hypothetical protein